jgi:acyl-CoA synthetase (NDP forming)
MASRTQLDRIFDPRSIAVVGASADPAKRGNLILQALDSSGYEGEVYPVNPRGGRILDREVLPSVDELPTGVDLAVLCTPAETAPGIVRALGARDVGAAVVLAVGYGESGVEGSSLQSALVDAAREAGVRIIGPNTSGMLNLQKGANLIGARGVRAGGLAVLVQSGNVALALMTEVTERSWDGISLCLGVGNGIDVGFTEALEYVRTDEASHAVIAYVEGLRDPRGFLASAARVTRTKPVVVIKSGRTAKGAEAALSHTGSVSGPYDRFSAGMAQAGIVEVTRTDELLHVAETLGRQPACPPGRGIAILSDGGGQGTLAADTLEEAGATMARLAPETRQALRALLGRAAAVGNPVDLAGAADLDPENFARALDVLVRDSDVGAVLLIGLFGGYGVRFADSLAPAEHRAAAAMAASAREHGKGLIVHTMYAAHRTEPLATLGAEGVPVIGSLEVATRCAVELQRRGHFLQGAAWDPDDLPTRRAVRNTEDERPLAIRRARSEGRSTLTEVEAREVLSGSGLEFGPGLVVDSPEAAAQAFEKLGSPAVLKLVSSAITHKSDAGGVVLGIESADQARHAFTSVRNAAAEWGRARGVPNEPARALVTPMLQSPRLEILAGAYRDPLLGPVLTVGAGGLWVEALRDVAHRVLPVSDADIEGALAELRVSPLLDAGRGRPAVDRRPLIGALRAIADLITRYPEVAEVEVNPLFVYADHVAPVDARVVLAEPAEPAS